MDVLDPVLMEKPGMNEVVDRNLQNIPKEILKNGYIQSLSATNLKHQVMRKRLSAVLILFVSVIACQKSDPDDHLPNDTPLQYSDSVFYIRNQPPDYTILPVRKPTAPGYFKANPIGLDLDSVTGQINISQSETGIRYKVYYLSPSDERLDSVKLVISGIDYADGIYELPASPVAHDTAFPIYNARPGLALPCRPGGDDDNDDDDDGGNDDDDDDNDCVFDETDLNGDGNDDVPGVIQDKLLIDTKLGTIDLEASFHAGVFGSSAPANGVRKDFTFFYRLNDASNRALNKITVRLYHFRKRSDIPRELLDELDNRSALSTEVNSNAQIGTGANSQVANSITISSNSIASTASVVSKPKRPPLIIIVSQR